MKTIEIIHQLQAQGHTITYYVRKDGGVLVRSFDGMRFPTGASGNTYIRQIAGVSISEARQRQLKYATRTRKEYRRNPKKYADDLIKKEYERVKKLWNRRFKAQKGKPNPAGYFGWRRIQYTIQKEGKEEAFRRIAEAEKYAMGVAYSKNVQYLEILIRDAGNKYNSQELLELADDVRDNAYIIREDSIYPSYQELYKLNQGAEPKDIAKNVRKILGL